MITADAMSRENRSSVAGPKRVGRFQLFGDSLTKFYENCVNTVSEADDFPKTEVQVSDKTKIVFRNYFLLPQIGAYLTTQSFIHKSSFKYLPTHNTEYFLLFFYSSLFFTEILITLYFFFSYACCYCLCYTCEFYEMKGKEK